MNKIKSFNFLKSLSLGSWRVFMQLLTPGLGLIIWTLLAFLVVFLILKKYAWPAILGGLKKREETIAESLASAERIKAEMAQMKSENESLLAQAREERAGMLKDAKTHMPIK